MKNGWLGWLGWLVGQKAAGISRFLLTTLYRQGWLVEVEGG
jgi:hypothetical protein